MAQVLDDVLIQELDADSIDSIDNSEVLDEVVVQEEVLPEKYRNKSLQDIIAMHQESERLIGKQGNEVGDLRRTVDDFIKTQTSKNLQTEEVPDLSDDDFYSDPRKATTRAIEEHPAIREAREYAQNLKQTNVQSQVAAEFPDYKETVNSTPFQEWVQASKVRLELFNRAQNSFDFDSAKELLSTWKERQDYTKKVTETSKLDRAQQLKSADMGSTGATETASKKKYRRSDIIKLMQTDPDRYDSMSTEIMAAYREGRVI
jgi:predicted RNA-binding protein YlqC (UPF0109 family)